MCVYEQMHVCINIKAKYEIGKLRSTIEISKGMSARKRKEHKKNKSNRETARVHVSVCVLQEIGNRQLWQGEVRPKIARAYFMYKINAEDTRKRIKYVG